MTSKIVAITQPNFAPWLGYFEMIDRSDIFVYLDDVQFPTNRKDWVQRNRIKSKNKQGWEWITVSIKHNGKPDKNICQTLIAGKDIWYRSMTDKLRSNYAQYPYFYEYSEQLFHILDKNIKTIDELNIYIIEWALNIFGIQTETIRSSQLSASGKKDNKLLTIMKELGGDFYLANNGSKPYINPQLFLSSGIGFSFQNYTVPQYKGYDSHVLPAMSFMDLLFAEGPDRSLDVIRQGTPIEWLNLEKKVPSYGN